MGEPEGARRYRGDRPAAEIDAELEAELDLDSEREVWKPAPGKRRRQDRRAWQVRSGAAGPSAELLIDHALMYLDVADRHRLALKEAARRGATDAAERAWRHLREHLAIVEQCLKDAEALLARLPAQGDPDAEPVLSTGMATAEIAAIRSALARLEARGSALLARVDWRGGGAGHGGPLPFLDEVRASSGRHDVNGTGPEAAFLRRIRPEDFAVTPSPVLVTADRPEQVVIVPTAPEPLPADGHGVEMAWQVMPPRGDATEPLATGRDTWIPLVSVARPIVFTARVAGTYRLRVHLRSAAAGERLVVVKVVARQPGLESARGLTDDAMDAEPAAMDARLASTRDAGERRMLVHARNELEWLGHERSLAGPARVDMGPARRVSRASRSRASCESSGCGEAKCASSTRSWQSRATAWCGSTRRRNDERRSEHGARVHSERGGAGSRREGRKAPAR